MFTSRGCIVIEKQNTETQRHRENVFVKVSVPQCLCVLNHLLVRSEVFQELRTLEGVYSLHVAGVQASFELGNVFHAFAFHPALQELVVFVDDFGRLLVNDAANFYG